MVSRFNIEMWGLGYVLRDAEDGEFVRYADVAHMVEHYNKFCLGVSDETR